MPTILGPIDHPKWKELDGAVVDGQRVEAIFQRSYKDGNVYQVLRRDFGSAGSLFIHNVIRPDGSTFPMGSQGNRSGDFDKRIKRYASYSYREFKTHIEPTMLWKEGRDEGGE